MIFGAQFGARYFHRYFIVLPPKHNILLFYGFFIFLMIFIEKSSYLLQKSETYFYGLPLLMRGLDCVFHRNVFILVANQCSFVCASNCFFAILF